MQRKMRRDEGDVVKKRLRGMIGSVILQTLDGVVGGGDGGVVAFFIRRRFDGHVVDGVAFGGEEVALVLHVERAVEAAVEHFAVDVPLAAVIAAIACWFEKIR